MKNFIMMCCAATGVIFSLFGETETVNGYTWTYRINNNAAELYANNSTAISPKPIGVVTIPTKLGGRYVTSIGCQAFVNCDEMTGVTIPSRVTSINFGAFSDCKSLVSVTIPTCVTSIGEHAFQNCSGLMIMSIGASVTNIGAGAFLNCCGLTNITLPNSITSIGDHAFQNCSGLMSMTIPDRVTSIGANVFYGCNSLKYVSIPNSVTNIGYGAFVRCSDLESIIIPDSMKCIDGWAFSGCDRLTSVTIPNSVTSIGECAFNGCSKLTNVTISGDKTDIGQDAFRSCSGLKWVVIGGATFIRSRAFLSCSSLQAVYLLCSSSPCMGKDIYNGTAENLVTYVPVDSTGWMTSGSSELPDKWPTGDGDNARSISNGSPVFIDIEFDANGGELVDEGLETTRLAEIEIGIMPDAVRDGYAFLGWFTDLEIGEKVTTNTVVTSDMNKLYAHWCEIGDLSIVDSDTGGDAVWNVDENGSLQKSEMTTIDGYTWTYSVSNGMATITALSPQPTGGIFIPSVLSGYAIEAIGDYVFSNCAGLTDILIPEGVKSIGYGAFYGCNSITNISIPEGVTNIGPYVLHCENLKSVKLPSSLKAISDSAFDRCFKLEDVIVPSGVTSIGQYAFDCCESIPKLEFPNTLITMGYRALCKCGGLRTLTIPFVGRTRGMTGTADAIFAHLFGTALGEVSGTYQIYSSYAEGASVRRAIPLYLETVFITDETIIPYGAFSGWNRLKSVSINNGVKEIGGCAFDGCCSLTNMIIPETVSSIGASAFRNCDSLARLTIASEIEVLAIGANVIGASTEAIIEDKQGYIFAGWTNAEGHVISDPFHSATAVTVSPWWEKAVKTLTVTFDANGGYGEMVAQNVLEGDNLSLAGNDFTRDGYLFLGWATSAHGDVVYVDGATIEKVDASEDREILYAVWKPCVPSIVPANATTFPNMSQEATISCEATDAVILYTTDGSDPAVNGNEYRGLFMVYESCTVRAVVRGAGRYSEEASVTLTRAEGLSEAANLYGYLMETDGSYPWTVVTDVSHDGVSCVRSGAIGNGGATHLTASVRKAGTVSFWWKAACEDADVEDGEQPYYYDYGVFLVDDVEKAWIAGHDTGWRKVVVEVSSGGKHVLRWEYRKDGATSYAPDCVWLDQVQWTPADGSGYTLTTPDSVPYGWLSGYGLGFDSDFETAAKRATGKVDANGRAMSVWQDYVAGTDPTNAASVFSANVEVRDGVPVVTWSPNLNTNGVERIYSVWGKENLTDVEWVYPTNSSHRFFKVTVEMP